MYGDFRLLCYKHSMGGELELQMCCAEDFPGDTREGRTGRGGHSRRRDELQRFEKYPAYDVEVSSGRNCRGC